jgi:hypothetical protein
MKRMKTVKQVGVRQSLLLAGLALAGLVTSYAALAAPAIVGSWHVDSPDFQAVATFLEDGTYFEAVDVAGDSVHTGVEWGTYSWNDITGEVTATSLGDTNGNWGLAGDVEGPQYMSIAGNVLTMTQPGCSGDCGGVAARVLHPVGSIVGTWLVPGGFQGTITFLADGSYIHGEEGHNGGSSGMERGTYSWDSVTGALMATSIITDTNGESGLTYPFVSFNASLAANGHLVIMDGVDQFELVAGPVPEPETYAMLLAGLGLVGFAARRRMAR